MEQELHVETFPNGLTLLFEHMPWLRSVAFTLLVRSGTAHESAQREGLAGVTLEMVQRGAGDFSSREIVERLDFLGVERHSAVTTFHSIFSAAMLPQSLSESLAIYADIVQRPHLRESDLADSKRVAQQEVRAVEDDLASRSLIELKRLRYREPYGRSSHGTLEGIEAIALDDVANLFADRYSPSGAILSVAGNCEWHELKTMVARLFRGWNALELPEDVPVQIQTDSKHVREESAQTYLALAYRSVPYTHPEYYRARGLLSVLSDGMSSRLFDEVREKRGLVYAISASHFTLRESGTVLCYAGSTTGRAQETLEITIATIQSLAGGIDAEELIRTKNRMKMSLVLEQESAMARSSQMASDWYYLGRIPTPKEVIQEIETLSCESLLEHFKNHPPSQWTLLTLGEEEVKLPDGI